MYLSPRRTTLQSAHPRKGGWEGVIWRQQRNADRNKCQSSHRADAGFVSGPVLSVDGAGAPALSDVIEHYFPTL